MNTDTFCRKLIEAAEKRPDKTAIVMIGQHGAETTSYRTMLARIRSIAFRLSQEQIGFGDCVALIGENHPNWMIAYLGALYHGAVVVPLDPASTVDALSNFVKDSDSKLAFVSADSLEKFGNVCERLGRAIPVVSLQATQIRSNYQFDDWAQTPTPIEFNALPPPAKSDDIAVLMYTSGTTGTPKAVPLTHGNIHAESTSIQEAMKITEKEVLLGLLPLFHAYSQLVDLWLAPLIGATVVYISELTSTEIERGLKKGRATALVGVPRLWYLFHKKIFDRVRQQVAPIRWFFRLMMTMNGWLQDLLNINAGRLFFRQIHESFGGKLRLAVSGGASFDHDVAMDFHKLGFTILQGYGLTETCGAATATRFEDNKIGSVGTPLKDVEIKIDNPNTEGVGEVLIRGPIVTPGYYRNPEANSEAFRNGWFRSGDLGRFDQQGHLYIVGRKKDVVKLPSGKNVFPDDVEEHYQRSSLVNEICVLGVPDKSSGFAQGEKLCAVIVPNFDYLRTHQVANAREVIRFELDNLGRELPEYQRVHEYIIRTKPLPRTATRKVRRFELRNQILESAAATGLKRDIDRFVFTDQDKSTLDSAAGRIVTGVIESQLSSPAKIHPQMNLELDLGLDSLSRAECVAALEQRLNVKLNEEQLATKLTVGDLITLVSENSPSRALAISEAKSDRGPAAKPGEAAEIIDWGDILANAPTDAPELKLLLKERNFAAILAYSLLRLVYTAARIFLSLEISGRDVLYTMKAPFLICPNHQSYVDPFLICSIYPLSVLKDVFYVGASEFFNNSIMKYLARMINLIPIDPDAHLLGAMRAGAVGLRAGKILNIYPEGQRSFDGDLHEFKNGAAILAVELNLPIIPVVLDGTYRVWPRAGGRIRLAKVRVHFGEPIHPAEVLKDDIQVEAAYEKLTEVLKVTIQETLNKMRRWKTQSDGQISDHGEDT